MGRWGPRLITLGVVIALVYPTLGDPPRDGFPLSTYPMFAVDRGPVTRVTTAVGRDADSDRVLLSPHLLAGTDEPIMAVRTARTAVSDGRSAEWCREVADRVARGPARVDGVETIEVVTETHEAAATLTSDAPPVSVALHATCPVSRR